MTFTCQACGTQTSRPDEQDGGPAIMRPQSHSCARCGTTTRHWLAQDDRRTPRALHTKPARRPGMSPAQTQLAAMLFEPPPVR